MSDLDDVDIESLRWLRTFVDAGTEPHDGAAGRALGLIDRLLAKQQTPVPGVTGKTWHFGVADAPPVQVKGSGSVSLTLLESTFTEVFMDPVGSGPQAFLRAVADGRGQELDALGQQLGRRAEARTVLGMHLRAHWP